MRTKTTRLWAALGWTSLACTLLLAYGFVWAVKDNWYPSKGMALPEGTPPPKAASGDWPAKPRILVTAVGDSLTRGTGDATGDGYVRGTVSRLQKALGKPVQLINNLGINGLETRNLLNRLNDTGFIDSLGQADLILISIGGNDLFNTAQNGAMADGGDIDPSLVEARMSVLEPRLHNVFSKLRQINPNARIVYVGLYNPFYDLKAMRSVSGIVGNWNLYTERLAEEDGNMTVVPTYDLFESNVQKYVSSDHFHPNEKGYIRISERIVQALQ